MKLLKLALIAVLCLAFAGCSKWWIDTCWKSGKFRLIAIDTESQMCLIHEDSPVALVGQTVFAVGADSRYIVLKQHPPCGEWGMDYDWTITNYFIVGRDKRVQGPLNKREFDALSVSLSLPPFTTVFKDLEGEQVKKKRYKASATD